MSIVHGRFGHWGDQLSIQTNFGRTLKSGGNGGNEIAPVYPTRSYFVGINTNWGEYLAKAEVYYIDLDELPSVM